MTEPAPGGDPYDELPYLGKPVVWMAPERLAVVSWIHGGPCPGLDRYRMLEVGCGDGANLIALAWYRSHGEFVGIDGSRQHIEIAEARARELGLSNLRFIHADLREADAHLSAPFDFITAHGVFSWVPEDVRDALLDLHHRWLSPRGLLFLDYNCMPGWGLRGMVRRFLLARVAGVDGLAAQVETARAISREMSGVLGGNEHPYSQLLGTEFDLVAEAEPSYLAHEYLNPYNRPYWSSELDALAHAHGLYCIAEADFDHARGRSDASLDAWLASEGFDGPDLADAADLVVNRQMRSPILAARTWVPRVPTGDELGDLLGASALVDEDPSAELPAMFAQPDGQHVRVQTQSMRAGLQVLSRAWPRGVRLADAFADLVGDEDDIRLLNRFGLLDLRLVEPEDFPRRESPDRLHAQEAAARGEITTADHRRMTAPSGDPD